MGKIHPLIYRSYILLLCINLLIYNTEVTHWLGNTLLAWPRSYERPPALRTVEGAAWPGPAWEQSPPHRGLLRRGTEWDFTTPSSEAGASETHSNPTRLRDWRNLEPHAHSEAVNVPCGASCATHTTHLPALSLTTGSSWGPRDAHTGPGAEGRTTSHSSGQLLLWCDLRSYSLRKLYPPQKKTVII